VIFPFIQCHHTLGLALSGGFMKLDSIWLSMPLGPLLHPVKETHPTRIPRNMVIPVLITLNTVFIWYALKWIGNRLNYVYLQIRDK
jgi:hypothetical protein